MGEPRSHRSRSRILPFRPLQRKETPTARKFARPVPTKMLRFSPKEKRFSGAGVPFAKRSGRNLRFRCRNTPWKLPQQSTSLSVPAMCDEELEKKGRIVDVDVWHTSSTITQFNSHRRNWTI
jgi:hypothetical protein